MDNLDKCPHIQFQQIILVISFMKHFLFVWAIVSHHAQVSVLFLFISQSGIAVQSFFLFYNNDIFEKYNQGFWSCLNVRFSAVMRSREF